MSTIFTLVDCSNVISCNYYPPIFLEPNCNYGLGLIAFYSYNTIQNVNSKNNKLYFKKTDGTEGIIEVPPGAYEISEIANVLEKKMKEYGASFILKDNLNTLKCEILSDVIIDFTKKYSIGSLLGFSSTIIPENILTESNVQVKIHKVNNIRLECNLINNAYINEKEMHTIFEFGLNVEPGYKIIYEPTHIIYMPINKWIIDNITIRVVDQDGDLVDFNNEQIVVRLELKKLE